MTQILVNEINCFRRDRLEQAQRAQEMMALQLLTGIDFDQACRITGHRRAQLLLRLNRLIERERQRGIRKHWSYNLHRHIALKQAFDRLHHTYAGKRTNKKGSA